MQHRNDKFVTIESLLLRDSDVLHPLTHHSAKIATIQNVIKSHLDESLSQHLTVANFDEDAIILHASNSAWASRLRYNIPEIQNIARDQCNLPNLRTIRIKVVPEQQDREIQTREIQLSTETKTLISEIAETVESDDLKAALLRLVRP
jgi:hypothetical protein